MWLWCRRPVRRAAGAEAREVPQESRRFYRRGCAAQNRGLPRRHASRVCRAGTGSEGTVRRHRVPSRRCSASAPDRENWHRPSQPIMLAESASRPRSVRADKALRKRAAGLSVRRHLIIAHVLGGMTIAVTSAVDAGNPARDRRLGLLQRARPHEQADVPAGNKFRHDPALRGAKIFFGVKDLFLCGDIVGFSWPRPPWAKRTTCGSSSVETSDDWTIVKVVQRSGTLVHCPQIRNRPTSPGTPSGNSSTLAARGKPRGFRSRSQRR